MNLSRMQIAAVKQMGKSLKPIYAKIERLSNKLIEINEEINSLENQKVNILESVIRFTNGYSLEQVLNKDEITNNEVKNDENVLINDLVETQESLEIDHTELPIEENITSEFDNIMFEINNN